MKEKLLKKGIKKRLLSLVLTLAMVLSLLPVNGILVYASEPVLGEKIESSAKEVSGTDFKVVSTKYENYGEGEWVIGGANNDTITVSRTAGNTTKNIGKLVFGYADVSHEDPSGYYDINTEYFYWL